MQECDHFSGSAKDAVEDQVWSLDETPDVPSQLRTRTSRFGMRRKNPRAQKQAVDQRVGARTACTADEESDLGQVRFGLGPNDNLSHVRA